MRQRRARSERFNIKQRAGNIRRDIRHSYHDVPVGGAIRASEFVFRIINMFGKTGRRRQKEPGGHGHLHCYWLWSNCPDVSEKGQVEEAVLAGETAFLRKIFASSQQYGLTQ